MVEAAAEGAAAELQPPAHGVRRGGARVERAPEPAGRRLPRRLAARAGGGGGPRAAVVRRRGERRARRGCHRPRAVPPFYLTPLYFPWKIPIGAGNGAAT